MSEIIFGLDIGTRSVTGTLVKITNGDFTVVDYYTKEHNERSMRDGQIHDVRAVAEIIKQVKETLEDRVGYPLKNVCVAAAGRTLKTVEASASVNLEKFPIQTEQDVKHLELSALQAAQERLANEQMKDSYNNYYCVGYSLLYYKLDQERIGSLIEQQGKEASAEIIATFLPKIVVESLLTAINFAGLNMKAMTLEPIAALHVLIPESMRRLNVVLVDIGAGTSDIAITNKGTVVAYGMVPVAGDEITEAISDQYLLDFPKAEQLKRNIVHNGRAEIEDILGFSAEITYEQLTRDIDAEIDKLAEKVADEILRLNSQAPRAVMLVGGGSLTPNITEKLTAKLDLPTNRAAVRGVEAIENINASDMLPKGPEYVTPIGIAITALERPVQYINVTVNQQNVRLFELSKRTVGDCLVQAGYEINRLYGKPGLAKFVTVNNQEITIPGQFGKEPEIYVNERKATVDTVIQSEDEIKIIKGADGLTAALTLGELIGSQEKKQIYFKDQIYPIGNVYVVNNEKQEADYVVEDGDVISWQRLETVEDVLEYYQLQQDLTMEYPVIVNKEYVNLKTGETKIQVNNETTEGTVILQDQDYLKLTAATKPKIRDLFKELKQSYWQSITVYFNDEKFTLKQPRYEVKRNDEILKTASFIEMNDRLKISEKQATPFIFQDIFRVVDIDLTNAKGNFTIYCNDKKAAFDTIIEKGDRLAIIWD